MDDYEKSSAKHSTYGMRGAANPSRLFSHSGTFLFLILLVIENLAACHRDWGVSGTSTARHIRRGWSAVQPVPSHTKCLASQSNDDSLRLLRQSVKIHAAVIVRHIDLASVDDWRIKLVEQKLHRKALRVP
jgi:hypothetical protein